MVPTDPEDRKRALAEDDASGTPETLSGKMGRAPNVVVEDADVPLGNVEGRRRASSLHLIFVTDKEAGEERARWWNSDSNSRWCAAQASAVEDVDAAVSARIAEG